MRLGHWMILVGLGASLSACRTANSASISPYPPETFQESDLVGKWEVWSGAPYSTEALTIEADHTFTQIYDATGGYHFQGEGTWWLEYRPSGCVYIHLEGMRYYYGTLTAAENGNKWPDGVNEGDPLQYWDECEERQIEMPDKVILAVGSFSDFPNGIMLEHMDTQRNVPDIILRIVRTQ